MVNFSLIAYELQSLGMLSLHSLSLLSTTLTLILQVQARVKLYRVAEEIIGELFLVGTYYCLRKWRTSRTK